MCMYYQGEKLASWRLIEDHAPWMPSKKRMLRMTAHDPAGVAMFFDLSMKLFCKHVLGVKLSDKKLFPDGAATEFFRCIFGPVAAFIAPIETQGRGGLHGHFHVYLLHAMTSYILDRLRRGAMDEEMHQRLNAWRVAMSEQASTMQYDSTCELGRQLGLDRADVTPVPLDATTQKNCKVDGKEEDLDKCIQAKLNKVEQRIP